MLKNVPLSDDAVALGAEAINQLCREKKIRAFGIKIAKFLADTAEKSVGVKYGTNAARYEISMLIEDFLSKKDQKRKLAELFETLCMQVSNAEKLLNIKGVGVLTVASFF